MERGKREAIQAKIQKFREERKQNPDRYPKRLRLEDGTMARFVLLSEPNLGTMKSITILETDDPQILYAAADRWAPEVRCKFIPLYQFPSP